MNKLREYVFQAGEVCFSVFKTNAEDAWAAAESTPLVQVSSARLELVDVMPHDPSGGDGPED